MRSIGEPDNVADGVNRPQARLSIEGRRVFGLTTTADGFVLNVPPPDPYAPEVHLTVLVKGEPKRLTAHLTIVERGVPRNRRRPGRPPTTRLHLVSVDLARVEARAEEIARLLLRLFYVGRSPSSLRKHGIIALQDCSGLVDPPVGDVDLTRDMPELRLPRPVALAALWEVPPGPRFFGVDRDGERRWLVVRRDEREILIADLRHVLSRFQRLFRDVVEIHPDWARAQRFLERYGRRYDIARTGEAE